MNTPFEDHPDLTRFALDDLPTAESSAIHETLAHNPSLRAEVNAIQELAQQLRAQAPIHDLHLAPQQRQRVLQAPIAKPTAARPRPQQRVRTTSGGSWSFLGAMTRIAAVLALLASAFWLGFSTKELQTVEALAATDLGSDQPMEVAVLDQPEAPRIALPTEEAPAPLVAAIPDESPRSADDQKPPMPAVQPSAEIVATAAPATSRPETIETTSDQGDQAAKASPHLASSLGNTEAASSFEFINASRRGSDSLALRPKAIRPPAIAPSKNLQAKPLAPASKPDPVATPRSKPDLFVHAWRSEVASCPWNSDHRLLRITIQLPAEQEAAQIGDHAYPLDIAFDPNNVREFRRLCSRNYPSAAAGQAGKVVVWYEFQPNGTAAQSHGNGKHIANVRLAAARFTTQAVGPFDASASQIQVLDRGQHWNQAHEDFVFETAQVGLHLLMDGAPESGQLNHQLVLKLAEHSQGTSPSSHRTHFIKTLRELQKLTGH